MSNDHAEDDVDRLYACLKCGISTPESALKESKIRAKKRRASLTKDANVASTSELHNQNSTKSEKIVTSISAAIRSSNKISPIVFYGSPHGAPVKRPVDLFRLLREIHVDRREHKKLIPRDAVWATFPRQEEAVRFVKTHANTYIFSYQDHLTGQRRFLVSTYDEFWRRYKSMDPKLRHHYEVIQMGLPCHLYYDLEFNKKINTGKNVDEMVDILISITFKVLNDRYKIQGNQDWVMELDSSTEEKFSRHVIIRIPNIAFKDNLHVGAFVSEICSCITSLRVSDPQFEKLYIKKDSSSADSTEHLFLDTGVYTRNRCFRLPFSSKAGKKAFLLPSGRFGCKNLNEEQVFTGSLICRTDADCDKLLVCKMDLECSKILQFESEVHDNSTYTEEDKSLHVDGSNLPMSYCSGKSPFPALDDFVESIASSGNVSGKIRSWYWFSTYGLIIYSMSRNRYCERIGREHKSNHVMYIVDFQRAGYYQKCYDPDCRGYRSPVRPVPWDVFSNCYDSVLTEKCTDDLNLDVNSNFHPNININEMACDGKSLTDGCKSDSGWWQKAVSFADFIENLKVPPELSKLGKDIDDDDCEWWMDAVKIASQVEEQIN